MRCLVFLYLMAPIVAGATERPVARAETTPTRATARLNGVWKVTELVSRRPGGEWRTLPLSRSIFIFTESHYSYMFVPGTEPRRLHSGDPNKPSDADKVPAYDSFVAASGTYERSGSRLALTAELHKNPNEMERRTTLSRVE